MDSRKISCPQSSSILNLNRKTTKKPVSSAGNGNADEVSLSEDIQSLQQAAASAHNASGIDENKVAEIRNAIARGELQINAEKLAQKMLEMEESLFKE